MQTRTRYILIGITFFFLLLTAVKSYRLTVNYGGGDLRTRVVGSRLLGTSHSPYFYKWHKGDGEFLLDPYNVPGRVVNGNVVTPATLYIIYPLAQLPYTNIKIIWNLLQFVAALVVLLLLLKRKNLPDNTLQWVILVSGIICSNIFLYNIERCQMYIFYTLVFAIMYRCYLSAWKYSEFLSGFVGGLFILFRPFAGIMGLGFLLSRKIKWVYGCITGFVIGCILFVLPAPLLWQDYFRAMQEYVSENTEHAHINMPAEAPVVLPAIIEGSSNITTVANFKLEWLNTLYWLLLPFGITITSSQSVILYVLLLIVMTWFFYKRKKFDPEMIFLFGFLAYMMAEQFILAPRAAYNVIQWLFPLVLISMRARNNLPLMVVLVTALLLWHNFPFTFPFQGPMAEILFFLLITFVVFFEKRKEQPLAEYSG